MPHSIDPVDPPSLPLSAPQVISSRFAEKAIGAKDPWVRLYARMSLAGLPRGGGNGDDIRMGILNIMRAHGIKEGHRPGLDEPFIEQWHQKLHQNTTAEDVTICEAYLAFLHSGNHDDYWRVLWDNGRITKERLESMHNPIRAWPMHLPHLIPAFNHYLWILKTCHAGADMDTAAEMAKGSLDDGTRWNVFDLLKNRNEWWAAGKIVEIREQMKYSWANSRDVLLLDIALDSYFKTCIERGDWDAAGRDGVMGGIELVLRNAAISAESEELRLCYGLWQRLMAAPDRWSKGWSEVAMAVCQRVSLALAHYGDEIVTHVQPHARLFGERCKIDPAYILNFSEEVIRSQSTFTLSMLLGKLEPQVRASAGAASWQIVSQQGSVFGRVLQTASLEDIQGKTFAEPTVVIAGHMGGMEDIPENVTAVLTQSATDILSHVAIRARSQGVLLATCFDAGLWGALASGHPSASFMTVDVTPSGDVLPATLEAGAAQARIASASSASSSSSLPPLTLPAPRPTDRFVLSDTEFGEGVVGAKARNLAVLRGKGLPDSIKLPRSIALPFGTFEKVLAHGVNTGLQGTFHALVGELENEKKNGRQGIPAALGRLRSLVASSLVAPPEVLGQISASAASVGLNIEASNFAAVWKAICGVWASKCEAAKERACAFVPYVLPSRNLSIHFDTILNRTLVLPGNDRAYLSRKARAVPESALVMSVLVQQVVPAQYAFVLHTADPLTGAPGATHGEVVLGMGESLVGNAPGRAFGFSAPSAGASGDSVQIASLPSKRAALWCPAEGTMIARSDTNGEDLEAFSGAGLYDSIPVEALIDAPVNYTDEGLLWDAGYSKALAARLVSVGSAVEKAFGSSQDIEGVVDASGAITVVQSRPIQIHKS